MHFLQIVHFKDVSYKLSASEKKSLLQVSGIYDIEVVFFFQTFTK